MKKDRPDDRKNVNKVSDKTKGDQIRDDLRSISVCKTDIRVLDQVILPVSAFALLSEKFTLDILRRLKSFSQSDYHGLELRYFYKTGDENEQESDAVGSPVLQSDYQELLAKLERLQKAQQEGRPIEPAQLLVYRDRQPVQQRAREAENVRIDHEKEIHRTEKTIEKQVERILQEQVKTQETETKTQLQTYHTERIYERLRNIVQNVAQAQQTRTVFQPIAQGKQVHRFLERVYKTETPVNRQTVYNLHKPVTTVITTHQSIAQPAASEMQLRYITREVPAATEQVQRDIQPQPTHGQAAQKTTAASTAPAPATELIRKQAVQERTFHSVLEQAQRITQLSQINVDITRTIAETYQRGYVTEQTARRYAEDLRRIRQIEQTERTQVNTSYQTVVRDIFEKIRKNIVTPVQRITAGRLPTKENRYEVSELRYIKEQENAPEAPAVHVRESVFHDIYERIQKAASLPKQVIVKEPHITRHQETVLHYTTKEERVPTPEAQEVYETVYRDVVDRVRKVTAPQKQQTVQYVQTAKTRDTAQLQTKEIREEVEQLRYHTQTVDAPRIEPAKVKVIQEKTFRDIFERIKNSAQMPSKVISTVYTSLHRLQPKPIIDRKLTHRDETRHVTTFEDIVQPVTEVVRENTIHEIFERFRASTAPQNREINVVHLTRQRDGLKGISPRELHRTERETQYYTEERGPLYIPQVREINEKITKEVFERAKKSAPPSPEQIASVKREETTIIHRYMPPPVEEKKDTPEQPKSEVIRTTETHTHEAPKQEKDYFKDMPQWAQEFIKESANWTVPPPAFQERKEPQPELNPVPTMVHWTNPFESNPDKGTTERVQPLVFGTQHEESKPELVVTEQVIKRTADRVYEILMDRMERESRRMGK